MLKQRRRQPRVVTAPKRLSLTFGADSAHPSEFDHAGEPNDTQGDVETSDPEAERKGSRDPAEMTTTQQNNLLLKILQPPNCDSLQSERQRWLLSEGCHLERPTTTHAK